MSDTPRAGSERDRQLALLAQIGFHSLTSPFDTTMSGHHQQGALLGGQVGLDAYRLNGQATAQNVIGSTFPTVLAMLGDEALHALARELWWTHPPTTGDLADWGFDLIGQLAQHPALTSWPYLPDVARLDWARHACERAADATFDGDSLHRLAHEDPAQLRLCLKPGTTLVSSSWPLVRLFEAHQSAHPNAQLDDSAVWLNLQEAIGRHEGETAVVWRHHWRAEVALLSPEQTMWMQALLARSSLQEALDAMPPAFDFTDWLTQALHAGWIWRVESTASSPPP